MAPLAPVKAIATLRRLEAAGVAAVESGGGWLSNIDRGRGGHEVQDADVAIQVESAFDLRQIVFAHQRLLVDQEQRHARNTGEVHGTEMCHTGETGKTPNRNDVHRP